MKLWIAMSVLVCLPTYADTNIRGDNKNDDNFYGIRPANIECVIQAAQKQDVPANVLLALASVEGGKNGQFVGNTNGSKDIGHFQINTIHWGERGQFSKYPSITQQDVAWRGCYNAELAAWMLHQHINASTDQDFWTRVANYHSKTEKYNKVYREKVIPYAVQWGKYLQHEYADILISQQ